MKKAIKIFVMSVMVALLYAAGLVIGSIFPPGDGYSQIDTTHRDSLMTLNEAKALLATAEQNKQVAAAMESIKPKERVVYRDRKVLVAVAPRGSKVVASHKASIPESKHPTVTIIYEAPRYSGTEIREKMTYAEWKMQRGLLQSKSYRLYEKYLSDGQGL